MNYKAMNMFLSEDNIKEHLEHVRQLRLKYSLLAKSVPEIKGKDFRDLLTSGMNKKIREEATDLLWQIKSHELFFNSFSINPCRSDQFKKKNISPERFLYDVLMETKDRSYGFLYVIKDKNNQ